MKALWWLCFAVVCVAAVFASSDAVGGTCAVCAGAMVYGRLAWGQS